MTETDEHEESILAMSRTSLVVWMVGLTIVTTGITWWYAPIDWSILRTLIFGVLMGVMSFYMLFINRLLVS